MTYTVTIDQTTIIWFCLILFWLFLPVITQLKTHIYNYNRYRKPSWIILALLVSFPLLLVASILRGLAYIGELLNHWSLIATSKILGSVMKDEENSKKS